MGCTLTLRPVALGMATVLAVGVLGCEDEVTAPEPVDTPALAATSQPVSWLQVSIGDSHTCGIASDNRAYC
jgi:Regulator of Chromosome Condensation (RCC1) repeat protein